MSHALDPSPLAAQNLSGGYPQSLIIQGVNLTVQPGEWLGLVGANGSGKSTLLRLLSRLLPPQTGAVLLAGRDLHTLSPTAIARQLALLPQQQTLPDGLTVEQLVSLGRSPHQPWWQWEMDSAGRQQVHQALAWTALTEFRDRPVADLSGGERQRAFLALALAQNPQVLLLDEPTTFLDIHYQLQILDLLKDLNRRRPLSIVTVLHDINLAARYCDRLALLRQGQIWAMDIPHQVLTVENLRAVFQVEASIFSTPTACKSYPPPQVLQPFPQSRPAT